MDHRPRRLRTGGLIRDMVADVGLSLSDIVMPLFVKNGITTPAPISSMPGVSQLSPDNAVEKMARMVERGVKAFVLFGVVDNKDKDDVGSICVTQDNPVIQTLQLASSTGIDAILIADLCFCEYTTHGHCGALSCNSNETVDNDKTLSLLGQQAIAMCNSGATMIAPSGMMDGMVGAIRTALDSEGYQSVPIMSYCVKYASSFYGPFRDAADGAPRFGNRKSYQMDFRRRDEWEQEMLLDLEEGADILMVKPAMAYLDILAKLRLNCSAPLAAYHVSGEYSMIHAAAQNGWIDLKDTAMESLLAIKRAGADIILTYFAEDLVDWLS